MFVEMMAATDWSGTLALTVTILKVAVGLGLVIFVHELGHFLVAKACGVKCEKFYIGFDIPMPFGIPSRFFRMKWGETEYGIGILPLGGYVKMLGQDDNPLNAEQEAERTRLAASDSASSPFAAGAGSADGRLLAPATSALSGAAGPPSASPFSESMLPAPRSGLDPRSYTAKAVWQRMLIISAGVIMNLIFAVLFATFAYRAGVPFTPCEIGHVIPGGPAWLAGLEADTRIVQIGQDGRKRDTLRFDFDLRQSIYTHGDSSDLPLLVRDRQGQEVWKNVRPFTIREGWESRSNIGISPRESLVLLPAEPVREGSAAAAATPELTGGERVAAVDGEAVERHRELRSYLARHPDRPITLTVERPRAGKASAGPAGEPTDVQVPPQRLKDVGLIMEFGPISAVRPGSPAALAGMREGDRLLAVDGQPLVDGMLLPELLRPYYDHQVTIRVQRGGSDQPVDIPVQLTPPTSFDWLSMFGCPMASDALGVAYPVTRVVKQVVAGSPADSAGFRPGDVVTGLELGWADPSRKPLPLHGTRLQLDDRQYTWPACFHGFQQLVQGEVVKLTYDRAGSATTVALQPVETDAYFPDRGLHFEMATELHQEPLWSEAVRLGVRQTWEDAFRVVGILKKLVTGRVSIANMGGIGSIAYVANREASQGTTRLLIFLTMLSANLAVLNFLPIPALDGGHMMFLIYEGIFRRPVNERLQIALTIAGVACLLGLMIFVNAMDIKRFFFF